MTKIPDAIEISPKIWTAWVGRTNVTDDSQTDDGRAAANSEREHEFTFAENQRWWRTSKILCDRQMLRWSVCAQCNTIAWAHTRTRVPVYKYGLQCFGGPCNIPQWTVPINYQLKKNYKFVFRIRSVDTWMTTP